MKKVLCLILALALCLGLSVPATAVEGNEAFDYSSVADDAAEHLAHLSVYYPELESAIFSENVELGKIIFSYLLKDGQTIQSNYSYIPILHDGEIIALADYDQTNGKLVGMSISLVDEINACREETSNPFAILWNGRVPYFYTEEEAVCLTHSTLSAYRAASFFSVEGVTFSDAAPMEKMGQVPDDMKVTIASPITSESLARASVSVTVPKKNQLPNEKICWAACVASVGEQQTGINYTAQKVADLVGRSEMGARPQDIINAMKQVYSVDIIRAGCPYTSTVIEKLTAKKPLIFGLVSQDEETGHAVVAYSFSGTPGSGTLGYMDPWGGTYKTIYSPQTGVFEFVLPLYGLPYYVDTSFQIP